MRLLDTQENEVCAIDSTTYEIHNCGEPHWASLPEGSFRAQSVGKGSYLLEMDDGRFVPITITRDSHGVVMFVLRDVL
jgi:hypothetical protein